MSRPPRPRLLADLTPLRVSRDFRVLFAGSGISYLGRQLTVVAIPFQVFTITGSSLAVGMIGLATLVPLVALSLAGGAIADAVDRRKLLLVTQLLSAATSAGLALNAASPPCPPAWPAWTCRPATPPSPGSWAGSCTRRPPPWRRSSSRSARSRGRR